MMANGSWWFMLMVVTSAAEWRVVGWWLTMVDGWPMMIDLMVAYHAWQMAMARPTGSAWLVLLLLGSSDR